MPEQAKITFYSIDKCGYYKHGEKEREFCTLLESLNELKIWNSNKEIGETCTYDINERQNIYRTYCFDLFEIGNNFLLTTWNETPAEDGEMASINISSTVGNVKVNLTAVPAGNIPGYPTYFWFIPEHEILATIQFHNQLNGQQNLVMYLNGFLSKCTTYACIKEFNSGNKTEVKIVGYAKDETDTPRHLNSRFETSLYKKKVSHIEFIKQNHSDIRKIIRKDVINMKINQDNEIFNNFFGRLNLSKPKITEEKMKIKYEINYSPSEAELNQMIDSWFSKHDTQEKWDDIGFVLNRRDTIFWLSHELPRDEFILDIKRDKNRIIDSKSLLNELINQKDLIISKIKS
jgi:hypothetical protein